MSRRGSGERTPEQREAARRERERRRYERAGEPVPDHLLEPHERAVPAPEPAAFGAPEPPAREPEPSFFDEPAPAPREPAPREPARRERTPVPDRGRPADREPAHEELLHREPPREEPPHREPVRDEPAHDPQATQQWDVTESWLDDVEPHHPQDPSPSAPAREAAPRAPEPEPPVPEQDPHATQAYDVHDPAHDPQATQAHDALADRDVPAAQPGPEQPSEEHEAPLGTKRVSGQERMHLPHIHRPTRGKRGAEGVPRKGRGVRVKRAGELAAAGVPAKRRRSLVGRLAALAVVVIAGAAVWFLVSLFQPFSGGEGSGSVTVRVPSGANASQIGDLLAERGVVSSSFFFGLRASISGERSNLKSGTFKLREGMSYAAAIDALTRVAPPPPTVTVAIPEGRSRRETVAIARRAGLRGDYLVASRRSPVLNPRRYGAPAGATLEGFLFPATYQLNKGAKAQRLVDDQLQAFKQNLAQVDLRYARRKNLTVFDVLTIASMVEREVSVARERPLVAAVIYNRLRDGIPLGIDATLRFEQHDWVNPLKQSTLDADTPYNTRTRQGLPPGPIGSPGLASIRAAANPARSNALYYVVKPNTCGEHAFSDTFERFQLDVQKYNAAREAAGGKSPTTC
jgi:UPF0755 protein